ncbi:MAG: tetraacyldisaccharide 4'-kinase [Gammaproteobacteria bacterium]|nr:tetraacyldisaccharide 4'-kinase [Gammaproteobacteria bacterium]
MNGLEDAWYHRRSWLILLTPLSALFRLLVLLRRKAYQWGLLTSTALDVPVIVVGNITVGGTGKTPLIVWLYHFLIEQGFKPGIISRGYKGKASQWPQQVRADSDPYVVGDESVMLARQTGAPIAVGPNRVDTAQALLEYHDCDLIISDDGLQHYAMQRDIEIAVIDGVRRLWNGRCLPAGPLREPQERLQEVDIVVANGLAGVREFAMKTSINTACRLDQPDQCQALTAFGAQPLHVVAGIGQPQRFFQALEKKGLSIDVHAFPDHHAFVREELAFDDDQPILMTAKDAVKCSRLGLECAWFVPLQVEPDPRFGERVLNLLKRV